MAEDQTYKDLGKISSWVSVAATILTIFGSVMAMSYSMGALFNTLEKMQNDVNYIRERLDKHSETLHQMQYKVVHPDDGARDRR